MPGAGHAMGKHAFIRNYIITAADCNHHYCRQQQLGSFIQTNNQFQRYNIPTQSIINHQYNGLFM
jgi:hypothetical protein